MSQFQRTTLSYNTIYQYVHFLYRTSLSHNLVKANVIQISEQQYIISVVSSYGAICHLIDWKANTDSAVIFHKQAQLKYFF